MAHAPTLRAGDQVTLLRRTCLDWSLPGASHRRPQTNLGVHHPSPHRARTPCRPRRTRRLVAVWLGITADQLAAIFKSRYPQLYDYESATYSDANGRKIAADFNMYGHGQTKRDYLDLLAHLEDPERTPPPEGYQAPFYKADREAEMRAAHTHFQARLDAEIAAGRWTPPVREAVQA
ncbi:hypothetical protein [Streptomyces olivaceus]